MYSIIDARNEFDRLDRMYGQDTSRLPIRFTNLKNSMERVHYKELPNHTFAPASVSLAMSCITSSPNLFYGTVHRAYAFVLSSLRDGAKHDAADPMWQQAYSDCKKLVVPAFAPANSADYKLYMATMASPYKKDFERKGQTGMAFCLTTQDDSRTLSENMCWQPSSSSVSLYYSMLLNVLRNDKLLPDRSNLILMLPDTLFSAFLSGKFNTKNREEETSLIAIGTHLRKRSISLFYAEGNNSKMWDTVINSFYFSLPAVLTEMKPLSISDKINDGVADVIEEINSSALTYDSLKKLRTGGKDQISTMQRACLVEHLKQTAGEEKAKAILDVLEAWRFSEKLSLSALRWIARGTSPAAALCKVAVVEPSRESGGELYLYKHSFRRNAKKGSGEA